jgi:hypothetical protein
MKNLLTLFKPRPKVDLIVVSNRHGPGHGAINGREVALWRPPVMLDAHGRTMPGVSLDLVANYLVASTSLMADTELGPVSIEWREQVSRFASVEMIVHAWGQSLEMLQPISVISQEMADVMDTYMGGVAQKVQQLHKGHQSYHEANQTLRIAMRKLERLRDDRRPHFNDAEFLFLLAGFGRALTMSALIPVSDIGPDQAVGQSVTKS